MTTFAERYKFRCGNYTKVFKIGNRMGDAAHMSVIEFVDRDGELAPAHQKPDEDTVIKNFTNTSPMYKKNNERLGSKAKGFRRAKFIIDMMNELKANKGLTIAADIERTEPTS